MQRTLFPAVPNTAEAQWLTTINALYAELDRNGGQQPFKLFRGWMRDRNIYLKEEVEALLEFLHCEMKPNVTLGHFGRQFLACETPEAQKVTMFKWLMGWNPLLVKSVFDALDTEAGGRLHSTHELYRMITSYAFPGEHITLPSFQAWIKWMAATEHIRYIGIRWGLGDLGKQALPTVKHIDVDEVLEEEEEARDAGIAEIHPMLEGVVEVAPTPEPAPVPAAAVPVASAPVSAPAAEEDLPDMPPEAPVPQFDGEGSAEALEAPAPAAPARSMPTAAVASTPRVAAPVAETGVAGPPAAARPAWFAAGPGAAETTAADLGFAATQYGADPALFSFRLAAAARLAVSGLPVEVWRPLFATLEAEGVLERYFAKKRPFEEILSGMGWLDGSPSRAALSWVLIDLMRLRQALENLPGFADQLEQKGPAEALYAVHQQLFFGAPDGAAFWYAREMTRLELWER